MSYAINVVPFSAYLPCFLPFLGLPRFNLCAHPFSSLDPSIFFFHIKKTPRSTHQKGSSPFTASYVFPPTLTDSHVAPPIPLPDPSLRVTGSISRSWTRFHSQKQLFRFALWTKNTSTSSHCFNTLLFYFFRPLRTLRLYSSIDNSALGYNALCKHCQCDLSSENAFSAAYRELTPC